MRAIDTIYNGHKFRSRLEARWAVFFDAINMKWEYEPEGFITNRGLWYLPDFLLPDCGIRTDDSPNIIGYQIYADVKPEGWIKRDPDGRISDVNEDMLKISDFAASLQVGGRVIVLEGLPDKSKTYMGFESGGDGKALSVGRLDFSDCPSEAFDIARQSRFEHGETPIIGTERSNSEIRNRRRLRKMGLN